MTLARYLRPLAAALSLVSLLAGPAAAQDVPVDLTGKYDSFYVFGDSLADTGNVWLTSKVLIAAKKLTGPAPPPSESPNLTYFNGRFSNGPVAFEYLWQALSGAAPGTPGALKPYIAAPLLAPTGAVNFAFGGTGTPALDQTPGGLWAPGLRGQVELFALGLKGRKPSSKALYAVVTGANDYRADAYNVPLAPKTVVANISASIERLYALGARDVMLLTLPDLGKLPYLTPEQAASGTATSADHNARLAQAVKKLAEKFPTLNLRLVDVNVVFSSLRDALEQQPPPVPLPFPLWALPAMDVLLPPLPIPVAPGDPPLPASTCLFIAPALCTDVPPAVRLPDGTFATPFPLLFWDVVHPTTAAHQALSQYLYGVLAAAQ